MSIPGFSNLRVWVAYAVLAWCIRKLVNQRLATRRLHLRETRATMSRQPEKGRLVELGLGEAQYLRMGLDHSSDFKIFLVANLNLAGRAMSLEELIPKVKRGLEHCQRLHPLLRCRLVMCPVLGKVILEEDPELQIDVHVNVDRDYHDVFTREAERKQLPIGINASSPHACWVFVSTEDTTKVQIALDLAHFAADGSGLGPIMHEFLTATFEEQHTSSPIAEYGAWPEVQEVVLQRIVNENFSLWQRTWRQIKCLLYPVYIMCKQEYVTLPRDDAQANAMLSVENHTLCLAECFTEQETSLLLSKCRENKVSVTAAVAAVFAEEICKRVELDRAFQGNICFVADSRTLCDPAVPASDLSPHVFAFPPYFMQAKAWKQQQQYSNKSTVEESWLQAQRVRQFITSIITDAWFCRFYALCIPFFLSQQPTNISVPMIQVSSWSAKSPVKRQYAGVVKVERVELLQNMCTTSWLNLSMYTMVGKLTVSMFTPVPRFDEKVTQSLFESSIARIRCMLE